MWRLVSVLPLAAGFDRDGHEAIGMTAMSAVKRTSQTKIKKLLKGKDAVDVAGWGHLVDDTYPWSEAFHYQKYRLPEDKYPGDYTAQCQNLELLTDEASCPGNYCLVQAMKHFYGSLTEEDRSKVVPLQFQGGVTFTDADYVKFLINLIGDLHQPLHFSPGQPGSPLKKKDDVAGANLQVTLRTKQTTLYNVWDTDIVQFIKSDSPMFWDGGWTNVNRGQLPMPDGPWSAADLYATEKDEFANIDYKQMFEKWALEAAKYACHYVYRDPVKKQMITNGFDIPVEDYDIWRMQLLKRILTAGARGAIVLNALAENKRATSFRSGTGVKIKDPQDIDEADPIPDHNMRPAAFTVDHSSAFQNFCINFTLFGIILACFYTFLHFTNTPPHKRFTEVQLQEMQKKRVI